MYIKNNKGFSLIEVLVTVGLIGILVGIAVPSYNGYKKNTLRMGIRADVGSGHKVYNAKYAVDSSFCHLPDDVGLSLKRDSNAMYKNKGFFGFGASDASCGLTHSATNPLYFESKGTGKCSVGNHDNQSDCTGASGTWTTKGDTKGSGAAATNCVLGTNTFLLGGYSNVSNVNTMIQADQDGKIAEHTDVPSTPKNNCVP